VSLRIGSSFPEPTDRRMLATWLSYDDLSGWWSHALTAPIVGHTIIYGMSDNATAWWDNTPRATSATAPQDSSEPFRAAVEARQPASTAPTRPGLPGRRLRQAWGRSDRPDIAVTAHAPCPRPPFSTAGTSRQPAPFARPIPPGDIHELSQNPDQPPPP
jgi:hypothetical protein